MTDETIKVQPFDSFITGITRHQQSVIVLILQNIPVFNITTFDDSEIVSF